MKAETDYGHGVRLAHMICMTINMYMSGSRLRAHVSFHCGRVREAGCEKQSRDISRIDWGAIIMKCYEVLEINYQESNSYYFKSRKAATAMLADIVDYNNMQGRNQVDDNSLVEYMYSKNRNNYLAIMQETELNDDEAAELLED
jgi:hypothetical protein